MSRSKTPATIVVPGTFWRSRKYGSKIEVVSLDRQSPDSKCQIRPLGDPNATERTVWRRTVANGYDQLTPEEAEGDLDIVAEDVEVEHECIVYRDGEGWYARCRACSFTKRVDTKIDADALAFLHAGRPAIFAGDMQTVERLLAAT